MTVSNKKEALLLFAGDALFFLLSLWLTLLIRYQQVPTGQIFYDHVVPFAILFVLNLGIGLFNLVPIGPLDGGRMLQLACHKLFDREKGNKIWGYIGLFFLLIIFINIAAGFGLFKLIR